ncbi:AAA domain-containing protein [Mycoplasmopsis verecunda]|uniref:Superfamily I DNA and/or RNA helicase n=1 Tax=Mycoplasmopsis verecunda TaxID=171291 RepID=A0A1T4KN78_9BACT|nr:AAA domain-containing protein [Mycoplasmopsis verecunda]WPB54307.1 AAA domain-containing protein [Mycoplasmopsis verecunda]SJZ43849.1 Superfamily I DNA and/or RNA helicase [Mycoplasmopsis verecunda]
MENMFENILNKLLDTSLKNYLVQFKKEKYLHVAEINEENVGSFLITNDKSDIKAKSNYMFANEKDDEFKKKMEKYNKIGRLSVEETGVNILNLAIGFLRWKDKDKNDLLSPLFIINSTLTSEKDEYYLDASIDNIEPNYTLAFKFKTEYNFDLLAILNEYLEQWNNIQEVTANLDKLLKSMYEKLPKMDNTLTINNSIYFGVFTYSKISIYNDLIKNKDKLESSAFYKQLNGITSNFNFNLTNDKDIDETVDYSNFYHCLESDGSQEKAIQAAIEGHSFVLQGPPGTGKSQTIINIITELMSRGKKVLFVAEKKAAVDVVYDTLEAKGFDKFILRLHSDDNNKQFTKKLLEDYEATQKYDSMNTSTRAEIANRINEYVNFINNYENLLIDSPDNKIPLFTLFNNYLDIKNHLPGLESVTFSRSYSEDEIRDITNLLKNYEFTLNSFKNISNSSWLEIKDDDTISFDQVLNALTTLDSSLSRLNYFMGENKEYIFDKNNNLVDELNKIDNIAFILTNTKWNKDINFTFSGEIYTLKNILKLYSRVIRLQGYNKITYSQNNTNIKFLANWIKQNKNPFFRMFSKKYKENKKELGNHDFGFKANLSSYSKVKKLYKSALKSDKWFKEIKGILPKLAFEFDIENLSLLEQLINNFDNLSKQFSETSFVYAVNYTKDSSPIKNTSFDQLETTLSEINDSYKLISNLFKLNPENLNYFSVISFVRTLLNDQNSGYVIVNKNNYTLKIKEYGLDGLLDHFNSNNYTSLFTSSFIWAYTRWNIRDILNRNGLISDFKRLKDLHEDYRNDIIALNKLSSTYANEACCKQIPKFIGTEEGYSIIKAEASKTRRHKPVKKVVAQAGDAIIRIKPCWMMSPLSVSTYLQDSELQFDVLIFDEASQIKTENALTSIFRANQYIVCGDTEQLPPTTFFEEKIDIEDTDDEAIYDLNAYESILSASASFLNTISLKWHYRSKYESLIYSSNMNVYGSSLVSFPNTESDSKYTGLNFIYTKGTYDERINEADAKYTIKKLAEIVDKFQDSKTIGVITMNITMANYLEKELKAFLKKSPKYNSFLSEKSKTKFFIKNIENVQGDERDIILLVIGFGPNEKGVISNNFGALNRKDSGYKRLNVAASRAKEAMYIISSMKHTDININKIHSKGAMFLKELLKNAELGVNIINLKNTPSETFKKDVQDSLRALGYQVDANVGASDFKLDLAIYDTKLNKYVLGIECDGTTFMSSRVAKDRDYLRSSVLQSRGWIIYRLWSADWFKNKEAELKQLETFIKKHISPNGQVIPREDVTKETEELLQNNIVEVEKIDFKSLFKPLLNMKELRKNTKIGDKAHYLQNNLDVISYKELNKIVSKVFANPKNKMDLVLQNGTFLSKDGFLWNRNAIDKEIEFKTSYDDERRDITFVHPKEWKHFITKAKEFNSEISYNELAKIALELLGFKLKPVQTINKVEKILLDLSKEI